MTTAGVHQMMAILDLVARSPGLATGDIGQHLDIPKSSLFDTLNHLEAAGLIERHRHGQVRLSDVAARFALTACDLGPISKAAEPVLIWLRQQTSALVSLETLPDSRQVLAFPPNQKGANFTRDMPIRDSAGTVRAQVVLRWRTPPALDALTFLDHCLDQARATLERHFDTDTSAPKGKNGSAP